MTDGKENLFATGLRIIDRDIIFTLQYLKTWFWTEDKTLLFFRETDPAYNHVTIIKTQCLQYQKPGQKTLPGELCICFFGGGKERIALEMIIYHKREPKNDQR